MSSTISQRIEKGRSKKFMAILAFGITDESFAVAAMHKKGEINASFLLGLNIFAYSSWNLGTWIGLLVPNIRRSKSIFGVVVMMAVVTYIPRILTMVFLKDTNLRRYVQTFLGLSILSVVGLNYYLHKAKY